MSFNLLFGSTSEHKGLTFINLKGMHKGKSFSLKIGGIKHCIYLAKLPGYEMNKFKKFIDEKLLQLPLNSLPFYCFNENNYMRDFINVDFNTSLYEGSYFNFRTPYSYIKIESSEKRILNNLFKFTRKNITRSDSSTNYFNNSFISQNDIDEYLKKENTTRFKISKSISLFNNLVRWIYKKYTGIEYLVDPEKINKMKKVISDLTGSPVQNIIFDENTQYFYKIDASDFMLNYYSEYSNINKSNLEGLDLLIYDAVSDGCRFKTMSYVSIGVENGINFTKPFELKDKGKVKRISKGDEKNYGEILRAESQFYTTIDNIVNSTNTSDIDEINALNDYKMVTFDLETYLDFSSEKNKEDIIPYRRLMSKQLKDEFLEHDISDTSTNSFIQKIVNTILLEGQSNNFYLEINQIICCSIIISNFNGKILAKKIIFNCEKLDKEALYKIPENERNNKSKYADFDSQLIPQFNEYIKLSDKEKENYTLKQLEINESKDKILIPCKNEEELLLTIAREFSKDNIFIINSFNGWQFDEKYLVARAIKNNCFIKFMEIISPYILPDRMEYKYDSFNNLIYGWDIDSSFKTSASAGDKIVRIAYPYKFSIDTMVYVMKANEQIAKNDTGISVSNSLNSMLHYWGIKNEDGEEAQKIEMPYTEISRSWEERDINNLMRVLEYCIEDSVLTYRLLSAANILHAQIEKGKLAAVEMKRAFYNAIGEIVGAIVYKYYWDNKIAYNDSVKSPFKANSLFYKNVGGEVKCFSYGYQQFITAVDAESMYPSQKEANNVDTATKILSDCLVQPDKYGLEILNIIPIDDVYGPRLKLLCKFGDHEFKLEDFCVNKQLKTEKKSDANFFIYNEEANYLTNEGNIYTPPTFDYVKKIAETGNSLEVKKIPESYLKMKIDKENNQIYMRVFFAQNPKDPITTRSIEYYSPKPQLLTQFRFARKDVKKILSKYKKLYKGLSLIKKVKIENIEVNEDIINSTHLSKEEFDKYMSYSLIDLDDKISSVYQQQSFYDTKQQTYKLIMNSEYGTSDSSLFPHYDSDCPSVVTWCARQLIGYCRESLTHRSLEINKEYLNDIIPLVERYNNFVDTYINDKKSIIKIKDISIINQFDTDFDKNINISYIENGERISRSLDKNKIIEQIEQKDIDDIQIEMNETNKDKLKITYIVNDNTGKCKFKFPNLKMVYQDTDSNYVKSPLISIMSYDLLKDPSEVNDEKIVYNLTHKKINILTSILGYFNDFFSNCSEKNINNFPIKFSFEAAFYSAYYLGKKHYFGIKVSPICIDEKPIDDKVDLSDFKQGMDIGKFFEDHNVKATGLSVIKRDILEIVKINIIKLMELLLNSKDNVKDINNVVIDLVKDISKNFDNNDIEAFAKKVQYKLNVTNAASAYNTNMQIRMPSKKVVPGTKLRLVYINPLFPYEFKDNGDLNILRIEGVDNVYLKDMKIFDLALQDKDVKYSCYLYKAYYINEIMGKLYEMITPELYDEEEFENSNTSEINSQNKKKISKILKEMGLRYEYTKKSYLKLVGFDD